MMISFNPPLSSEQVTLRDHFAGQAILAALEFERESPTGSRNEMLYRGIARRAYLLADAMLQERKEK